MKKRFMSIALALVLVLGMLPTTVVAAESGGTGSLYAITTSRMTQGDLVAGQKYTDEVSATLTYSGTADGVKDALLKFELTEQPDNSKPSDPGNGY